MKKGFFLLSLLISGLVQAQEIKSVNFVQEGEVSKLVIEADKDIQAERFHVTEDKQIILDLKNAKISPKLLRGIDTSEFPGSTVYISGYKKPGSTNDIRFAVQLRDNVRSILDTKGTTIVLNIENRFGVFSQAKVRKSEGSVSNAPLSAEDTIGLNVPKSNSIEDILANLTLSGPKKYIGKRISINVKDIQVADLLNMIADTSGFNIIIDQDVTKLPPMTLTITNTPWDQALDTIMNLGKLVAQKNANILIIKTAQTAAKDKEDEIKAAKLKEGLEPLVTRVFLINYATLGEISKIIRDYLTPTRATMQSDERTNSLIVKDTVESIERIKKIIETLDTQTPQILIEAKVVEATETFNRSIGLVDGVKFGYDPISPLANVLPGGGVPGGGAPGAGGGVPIGPGFSFSSAGSGGQALGLTVGLFKRLSGLNVALDLFESEQRGRVITSPRIVTQNKKPATITSSEQTTYRTSIVTNGIATENFNPISANTTLTVTPQVTNDGAISMQITLAKSDFTSAPTQGPPNIDTRNVNTNVLVDNGSTIVIGGLYKNNTLKTESGIPFLRNLPLLGWLFRKPNIDFNKKNELIVFITPRILNQEEAGLSDRTSSAKSGVTATEM